MGLNTSIMCLSSVAEGCHLPPLDLDVGGRCQVYFGVYFKGLSRKGEELGISCSAKNESISVKGGITHGRRRVAFGGGLKPNKQERGVWNLVFSTDPGMDSICHPPFRCCIKNVVQGLLNTCPILFSLLV